MRLGKIGKIACGVLFCVSPLVAVAVTPSVTAKVLYTGIYGNGDFFVLTDTSINETGCVSPRFDVISTNPNITRWLSIAMAAKAGNRTVMFQTKGCFQGQPTLDTTRDTWFLMQ